MSILPSVYTDGKLVLCIPVCIYFCTVNKYFTTERNCVAFIYLLLTLPMQRLLSSFTSHTDGKSFENHLNPVMLVFIGKFTLSTLSWVPICQGFSHFSGFMHPFVLARLATSSIRVNTYLKQFHFSTNSLARSCNHAHRCSIYVDIQCVSGNRLQEDGRSSGVQMP